MASIWEELKTVDATLCGKEVRTKKHAEAIGTVVKVNDGRLSVKFRDKDFGTAWLSKDEIISVNNVQLEQEVEHHKQDAQARQKQQNQLCEQQCKAYAEGPYPLPLEAVENLKALQAQLDAMDRSELKPFWKRSPESWGKQEYMRKRRETKDTAARKEVHDAALSRCKEYGQHNFKNDLNSAAVDAAMAGNVAALRNAAGGCFSTFSQRMKLSSGADPEDICGGDLEPDGFFYGTATIEDGKLPETGSGQTFTLLGMGQVAKWSDDVLCTLAELGVPASWTPAAPKAFYVATLSKNADGAIVIHEVSGAELNIAGCHPDSTTVKELAERVWELPKVECDEVKLILADGTEVVQDDRLLRDAAVV